MSPEFDIPTHGPFPRRTTFDLLEVETGTVLRVRCMMVRRASNQLPNGLTNLMREAKTKHIRTELQLFWNARGEGEGSRNPPFSPLSD